MTSQTALKLELGLEVYKGDWEGSEWTITGNPRKSMTVKEFGSAYDFEDFVKEKINCKGISFDSEYCQFFAYAKTKARAVKFANDIDAHFAKVRAML
jgi:hypothetical protein